MILFSDVENVTLDFKTDSIRADKMEYFGALFELLAGIAGDRGIKYVKNNYIFVSDAQTDNVTESIHNKSNPFGFYFFYKILVLNIWWRVVAFVRKFSAARGARSVCRNASKGERHTCQIVALLCGSRKRNDGTDRHRIYIIKNRENFTPSKNMVVVN